MHTYYFLMFPLNNRDRQLSVLQRIYICISPSENHLVISHRVKSCHFLESRDKFVSTELDYEIRILDEFETK